MADKEEVRRARCDMCSVGCPVEAHIRNGRLERLTYDRKAPDAEELRRWLPACPKARHAAELYYHPGRINFPLKRVGEKGEGKWQQISWEQALDEIADKIREIKDKYGPEALVSSKGTGRTDWEYTVRFFNAFGSPNHGIGPDHICHGPHVVTSGMAFGWPGMRGPVTKDTKLNMMWGQNPDQSSRRGWLGQLDLLKAGMKLIVIDPRKTAPAEKADIWLQIRPGTDCALAMSMINIIIEEDLYDKEFVNKWCYGFDKLRERAREFPVERAAEITWVPAEKIRAAARMCATIKPAVIGSHMGLQESKNNIESTHSLRILTAITGNVDIAGANRFTGPHDDYISNYEMNLNELLSPEQRAKQLGADRFKLQTFPGYDLLMKNMKKKVTSENTWHPHGPTAWRAMLTGKPYPVRAMITIAGNPMINVANTKLVYKALKSLDLYVVHDYWMTPSAELADYVTPAADWLERPTVFTSWDTGTSIIMAEAAMPAKVEGQWDRINDYDFFPGLS